MMKRYIEFHKPPGIWEITAGGGGMIFPTPYDIEVWEVVDETEEHYVIEKSRTILWFMRKRMYLQKDFPYIRKIFSKEE